MMSEHYYNTNRLQGSELSTADLKASKQEDIVLFIFNTYRIPMAPHEVQEKDTRLARCPVTSIRRAITNLTNSGILEKTDDMVSGEYGKPVHRWKLKITCKQEQMGLI